MKKPVKRGVIVCAAAIGLALAAWFAAPWFQASDRVSQPAAEPTALPTRHAPPGDQPAAPPAGDGPSPIASATDPRSEMEALEKEAIDVAQRVLADFPKEVTPLYLMGNAHMIFGHTAEATRWWEKCLREDPDRADVYFSMGMVAEAEGDFEKVAALWGKALRINPDTRGIREPLARVLIDLGRAKEAIRVLEQDIEASPKSSNRHFLLGQAYRQLKEYSKAKEHYETAIQIQPDHTHSYYGLVKVCAKLQQPDKAEEYREQFLERKAADLEATRKRRRDLSHDLVSARQRVADHLSNVAQFYSAAGFSPKAEELWERAAILDPKSTRCRLELASLYQQRGRHEQSLQMYEELTRIDPENAKYRMYLGMLNAQLGNLDAAQRAFEKVLELAPERSWGHQGLAQVYLNLNTKLSEAKKHAQAAVKYDPAASNYFILSQACIKTGDTAGALSALRRAVQLDPHSPKYRRQYELLKQGN